MIQSRLHSFCESCVNIAIGLGVAFIGQLIIFPLVGVHAEIKQNVLISMGFTAISLLRSYIIRRFFNAVSERRTEI